MQRDQQKGYREKLKVLRKSKGFLFVTALFVISLMGTGLAYYVLTHQSQTTYTIQGGVSAFGVTEDLSPAVIDVSVDLTDTQQIILTNDNSPLLMIYNLTTSVNNTDSSNCDEVNDISFLLEKDNVTINGDGNFTMDAGTNTFDFSVTALNDRVCPSTIDVTIDFAE